MLCSLLWCWRFSKTKEECNSTLSYFFFKHLNWSIIALQWCVSFCFIQSESAVCIHISRYPLPLVPPFHSPHPTPLGGHKAWAEAPVLYSYITLSYFKFYFYGFFFCLVTISDGKNYFISIATFLPESTHNKELEILCALHIMCSHRLPNFRTSLVCRSVPAKCRVFSLILLNIHLFYYVWVWLFLDACLFVVVVL